MDQVKNDGTCLYTMYTAAASVASLSKKDRIRNRVTLRMIWNTHGNNAIIERDICSAMLRMRTNLDFPHPWLAIVTQFACRGVDGNRVDSNRSSPARPAKSATKE